MIVPAYVSRVSWLCSSSGNFYGSEIRRGGLNFGPGIFLGLFEAPGVFLGCDFCLHSIIPVTRNLKLPPPPWGNDPSHDAALTADLCVAKT